MRISDALTAIRKLSRTVDIDNFDKNYDSVCNQIHTIEGLCRAVLISEGYNKCPGLAASLQDVAGCEFCNQVVT